MAGDRDGEYKPHVLRSQNPWKGTGQPLVQLREELVETTTSTLISEQQPAKPCDLVPSDYQLPVTQLNRQEYQYPELE